MESKGILSWCFMKKGFTLVELLVVVLVIGVLAAVAVPQYQKAVDKARVSEWLSFAYRVRDSLEISYLQTGKYPASCKDLEPGFHFTQVMVGEGYEACVIHKNMALQYYPTGHFNINRNTTGVAWKSLSFVHPVPSTPGMGKIYCRAVPKSTLAEEEYVSSLCMALGGKKVGTNNVEMP